MNTIERIEAHTKSDCALANGYLAVSPDEWAAIKAVVEKADDLHTALFVNGLPLRSRLAREYVAELGEALSKLEGE